MRVVIDSGGGAWDGEGLLLHWQRSARTGQWRALVRRHDSPGINRQMWVAADRVRPHPSEHGAGSPAPPRSTVRAFG